MGPRNRKRGSRDKSQQTKQSSQRKRESPKSAVTIYDLDDVSRVSKEIPDQIKIGIANVIMTFSEMENSAESVICVLSGLSTDDGKLLTKLDSAEKLELAKKFSERYGMPIHPHPQTTSDIWLVVRQIVEARNKIAHGLWHMIDGNMPLAVSNRIRTAPGRVTGEAFPLERLVLIAENCLKIRDRLDGIVEHVLSLPTRPPPLSHQPRPILPEYPLPIEQ